MNMQNVSKLVIPEGEVKGIRNKDGVLLWGRTEYSTKYSGNCRQSQYAGKNLLPYPYSTSYTWNGVTFISSPDGTVVLNGKNNGNGNSYRHLFYNTNSPLPLSAGTYYFIAPDNNSVGFVFHTTGGSYVDFDYAHNYSATFSSDVSVDQIYIQVRRNDATTFRNLVVYPMLSKLPGQTKANYEPYNGGIVSPTPNDQQNVEKVTGSQSITVAGKNLFDENNLIQNVYFDKDEIEPSILSGGDNNIIVYVPCEASTAYSFRVPYTASNPPLGVVDIGWTDTLPAVGVKVYGGARIRATTQEIYTYDNYQTGSTAKHLVVRFQGNSFMTTGGGWELVKQYFQIEKSATATNYEPPQVHQYNVALGSLELCKVGNYQDYIYKNGSNWYVYKAIGKCTFNGASNENWYISGGAMKCNNLTTLGFPEMSTGYDFNHDTTLPIYSNYGVTAKAYRIYNGDVTAPGSVALSAYGTGGGNDSFYIYKDNYTETTWKTKLSSAPLTCYYVVKTPVETQITDSTLVSQLEAIHQFLTRYGYTATVSGNLPIIVDKTSL